MHCLTTLTRSNWLRLRASHASLLVALLVFALLSACASDDPAPEPSAPLEPVDFTFSDGFETSGNALNDVLPGDNSRWTNVQLQDPDGQTNVLELSTATVREGQKSLRVLAKAANATLSKADIEKAGFAAPVGSTLVLEASLFIAGTADLEDLFLADVECCSCWDPSVPDNQCPGVRLTLKAGDFLAIERGKILGSTLTQTSVPLPRDEWVDIAWEMTLSDTDDGRNVLRINGEEALVQTGANLPNADEFRDLFAQNGIAFELQQPVVYERFQIGATANPTSSDAELFVDDVRLDVRL